MKVAARKLFRKRMLPAYENGGIVSGMDMGAMPPPPPMEMGMDMGAMPPPPPMDPASGGLQVAAGMIENFKNIDQQLDMVGDNPEGVIQALTGKSVPQARDDLAGIVGLPDAQQTPDSVLALVQPTLLMAEQAAGMEQGGIQTLGMDEPPPTMDMAGVPPDPFPQAALGDPSNPIAAPTVEVPAARFGGYVQGFYKGGLNEALQYNPYRDRSLLAGIVGGPEALQMGYVPGQQELDQRRANERSLQSLQPEIVGSMFGATRPPPDSIKVDPAFSGKNLADLRLSAEGYGYTPPSLSPVDQGFSPEELEEQQRQQSIIDSAKIDRGEAPPSFQNIEEAQQYYRKLTGTDSKIDAETTKQQAILGEDKPFKELYDERVKVFTDEGLLTPPVTEEDATERVNKIYGDINKDAAGEFWLAIAAAGGKIANSPGKSLFEAIGGASPELAANIMQIGRDKKALMRERGLKIEDLVRESERLRRGEQSAILSGAINDAQALNLERKKLELSIAAQYAPKLKVQQGIHYRDKDNSFGYKKEAVKRSFLVDENNLSTVFLIDPELGYVPINNGFILGDQSNVQVTTLPGGNVQTNVIMPDGTNHTYFDISGARKIRPSDWDPRVQSLESGSPGRTTFHNLQNPVNKKDVLLSDTVKNERELFLTDGSFRRDYLTDQQNLEKSLAALDGFLELVSADNAPVGVQNVIQQIINKGTQFADEEDFLKQFENIKDGELFRQKYNLAFKQAEFQYTSSDRIANRELEVVREYLKEQDFFSNPIAAIMKAQEVRKDVYNGLQKVRAVTTRIESPEEGGFTIPNITVLNDITPLGISKTTAFDVANPADRTFIQAAVDTLGVTGKISATGEQGIATKLEDKFIFVPEKMIPGLVAKNNNLKKFFGDEKKRRGRIEKKIHGDKKGKGFYIRFNQLTPDRIDTSQFGTIVRDPNNPQY